MEERIIQFEKEKQDFFKKHDFDYVLNTSSWENNQYIKTYSFEDGAIWYELTSLISEKAAVESHGLIFEKEIEMYRTEYWSTESRSQFFYEKA